MRHNKDLLILTITVRLMELSMERKWWERRRDQAPSQSSYKLDIINYKIEEFEKHLITIDESGEINL